MRRALDWLRITDEDGKLSLTHLSLGVALYCTVRGVAVSWTEWAAVVVTLAAYQGKKYMAAKAEPEPAAAPPVVPPEWNAILNRVAALESSKTAAEVIGRLRRGQ